MYVRVFPSDLVKSIAVQVLKGHPGPLRKGHGFLYVCTYISLQHVADVTASENSWNDDVVFR